MSFKLANNAVSKLSAGISGSDTSITVLPGDGAKFPAITGSEWFPLTLIKATGEYEIVKCTARTSDTMTIARAQEGTSAIGFSASDRVELRPTSGVFADLQQSILSLLPTGFGPLPWSRTAPPAGWIWADGRLLLPETPYQALRSAYIADGFPWGGDGTNPRIPDMRGRTAAGIDDLGGSAAGRLTGGVLGAALGAETHTLLISEMPQHNHGVTDPGHAHGITDPGHTHSYERYSAVGAQTTEPGNATRNNASTTTGSAFTGITVNSAATGISTQNAGSGDPHNNVQPTLVTPWIIKV